MIGKGHSPYTIGRGSHACLLVHGIAASPAQMRVLAEFLADSGLAARSMLLPGHGTHPRDLDGIVWQDWYEHLHDEYRQLKLGYEEVSLVGFSIGAALAAHYAAHNRVDRLVLLNIPLCPFNDLLPRNLMLKIYGAFFKTVRGNPGVIFDAEGKPFRFVYEHVPTAILGTMSELIGIIRSRMDRITSPTLIIQSRNDKVSGARSGPLAFHRLGSSAKRLVVLEKSRHNLMMDVERQYVFEEIARFLSCTAMQPKAEEESPALKAVCQV